MNNWKKNTALFLSSQAISLFGSSVVSFAIVWFVTRQTHSGLWVSLLTISSYLPQFVVSFFAGVWADRYSRKKLIIAADTMIAAFTCLLVLLIPRFTNTGIMMAALIVEWHKQMAREGHLYQAMIGKDLVGAAIVFPDEAEKSVYIGRIFIDNLC